MSRNTRDVAGLCVGLCIGLMAATAGAQGMIGPSLAEAKRALAATEEAAVEMSVGLSCAVVDSRGALVAMTRMDSARYFTADVAVGNDEGVAAQIATLRSARHGRRRHSVHRRAG